MNSMIMPKTSDQSTSCFQTRGHLTVHGGFDLLIWVGVKNQGIFAH
jgi:hypothetical protein